MDSTPLLPLKPSASKLPIKRKTPDQTPTPTQTHDDPTITTVDFDSKPPPFKFHRIWTEPDEIRFLQGLLNSSSENLAFPKDLSLFYERFSHSMSQPYTKSQLSEKLRRLRKKFRVTCSRISRGLDMSLLSAHDRALYDLSSKLWSPEYAATSPFCNTKNNNNNDDSNSSLVGVKVSCSPDLEFNGKHDDDDDDDDVVDDDGNRDVKMSEENVDVGFGLGGGGGEGEEMGRVSGSGGGGGGVGGGGIGGVTAKCVLNVFDECLKEVRMAFCPDNSRLLSKEKDFQRRWREQRVAEFDLLARRLRLVLDNSLNRQSECK